MIDVNREQMIGLDEAARIARVTIQCVYGWVSGKRGRRLESVKLGGKRMTSREALQRFAEQDDGSSAGAVLPTGPKTDYDSAIQELREHHGSY